MPAVTVWSVVGEVGASDAVATGLWFATVTVCVAGAPSALPSFGVASTMIVSPWPARPAIANELPVAPATTEPFTFHT